MRRRKKNAEVQMLTFVLSSKNDWEKFYHFRECWYVKKNLHLIINQQMKQIVST